MSEHIQSSTPPQQFAVNQRIAGLDILRVSLAFLIFLFHSSIHLGCHYGFFDDLVKAGKIAMTGFFMLSGFALQYAYRNYNFTTKSNILKFYKKRLVSIYPLYIIAGTLYVMMSIGVGAQTLIDNIILLPLELIGMQSMYPNSLFMYSHNSGTWFVSCIFICYFAFPIIKTLFENLNKKTKDILLIIFILMPIYVEFVSIYFEEEPLYTNAIFRLFEFILGMIIFLKSENNLSANNHESLQGKLALIFIIIAVLITIIGVSVFSRLEYSPEYVSIPGFALIIYILSILKLRKMEKSKPLRYLSAISYAFFLAQFFVWQPIKFFTKRVDFEFGNVSLILIAFILCVVLSVLMHEYIEKKFKIR